MNETPLPPTPESEANEEGAKRPTHRIRANLREEAGLGWAEGLTGTVTVNESDLPYDLLFLPTDESYFEIGVNNDEVETL